MPYLSGSEGLQLLQGTTNCQADRGGKKEPGQRQAAEEKESAV